MAYVKIIFQNSPSTATPLNAQNLNHMDDQIALNDQRLTELEGAHVSSFNGRTGAVTPSKGDYDIGQIAPLTGAQVGQVPVVVNVGTEENPELEFQMGAGGGGGHVIQNASGTDMAQESAMQFPDSHVSDDSTNGRTVVENVKEVTLAELEQATERGMYLATDEESVPIGEIGEDYVEVEADGNKTRAQLLNELFALVDISKVKKDVTYLTLETNYIYRLSRITSNDLIFFASFGGANQVITESILVGANSTVTNTRTQSNNSVAYADGSSVKPSNHAIYRLYYGTSSTVINLKTSADYCMMSDGVTSVESAITDRTYVAFSNVSGGKTYTLKFDKAYTMALVTIQHSGGNNRWCGVLMADIVIPIATSGSGITVTMVSAGEFTITANYTYHILGIMATGKITVA